MTPTGEEIRARLGDFAAKWSVYEGTERSEAQTFLTQLFSCYGTDREERATFEEPQRGGFIDLLWPRVCLFEMKRPSEAGRLAQHREQALGYWASCADAERNVPAPTYVVICAFRRLEIWQPGAYPDAPVAELDLVELPDRYETLLFLAGREPVFAGGHEQLTRAAVSRVVDAYQLLRERQAAAADVLRDFILQSVWCMFAEDLGQLEAKLFTRLLDRLLEDRQRSSIEDLGQLFEYLNSETGGPEHGLYAGVRYANGGLFREPARVHLEESELEALRAACESDWTQVQPSIFGSLMEGGLGHDMQWALGAHYTHEADILKVINPTIVRPWQERIENISTHAQAVQAQNDLMDFVVLDPACGSGNFLYVAYQELRRLEQRLKEREAELRRAAGMRNPDQGALSLFFPLSNIQGIELNGFAVSVAKVTLWMGHKLTVDRLGLDEATLPLADLSAIRQGDALRMTWPRADAIVGNPPFHGDRNLRGLFGDDYVEWLRDEFDTGVRDYCVYWFRKAHDHLEGGSRAGLVGTNSISQNRGRDASLNYLVEHGGIITEAVSSQDWPGEANVDVSIVNWVKRPTERPTPLILDGEQVAGIDTALRPSTVPIADVDPLPANRGIAFQGFLPGAPYDLTLERGDELLSLADADYSQVVRPYLDGRDITRRPTQQPSRYVVDFAQMPLEEAMAFPAALEVVRAQAKEPRESSNSYARNPHWWQFLWPRPDFRRAVTGSARFIAGTRVSKRITFCWCESHWRPSDSTNIFALEDDYSMAVLCSTIHTDWARGRSSTLEDRIRYTPSSAFDTFPWPANPSTGEREPAAEAGAALLARRSELCATHEMGLTELYNLLDEGGFTDLVELQRNLDEAVARAYGWTSLPSEADRNARLLELNRSIRAGEIDYEGPGTAS